MSQPPEDKLPVRRVSTAKPSDKAARSTSSTRSTGSESRSANAGSARSSVPVRSTTGSGGASRRPPNRNIPERRDPFPYVMGAVIGALVMGLVLVIFLVTSPKNTNTQGVNQGNTGGGATTLPNAGQTGNDQVPGSQSTVTDSSTSVAFIEPIRMPIADFMTLYSDPATRPIIVDVRTKASYDEGHIAGAVSIPNEETDSRLSELPSDKMIIAYCQ